MAADLLIGKDHLVDAVVVPLIVGRHLIDPFRHAAIRIAREDGHRPFVVARTLLRIPGRGIAGPVIDEVSLRIIGDPAPCAAAADLPLIALPGLQAGVLADRLAVNGTSELSTLKQWILDRTRLISILGLSGSGKTDRTTLQTDLIKFLSQQQETNPPTPLSKGGRRD